MEFPFLSDFMKKNARWEWMHDSWKGMVPRKDFNESKQTDESENEYIFRIQKSHPDFPALVLAQLFYEHVFTFELVQNYGWIDYDRVTFTEELWSNTDLERVRIYSEFQDYVDTRSASEDFGSFCCIPKDLKFWKENGTWRIPVVILDCSTVKEIPHHAEIMGDFQLIEGHSRLGYAKALHSMAKNGKSKIAEKHKIFLMRVN